MTANWKKALFITIDLALAGYLVCAFIVFNKPDESKRTCTNVTVEISDESANGFISTKEIKKRLQDSHLYPLGKRLDQINVRQIEDMLKSSPFVKTAQCYKTDGGTVNIGITQLTPVIRVKADNGDDYYIDDKDCVMPNSSYISDLIIATGNISRSFAVRYVAPLGQAIMSNELWRNLVVQINVLPDHSVEIVPRVGDHVVLLGKLPEANSRQRRHELISDFVETKLTRLAKFYKYGLSQAGWNKYSYVNIEFDNQIICKRRTLTASANLVAEQPVQPTQQAETPSAATQEDPQQPATKPSAEPQKAKDKEQKQVTKNEKAKKQ